MGAIAEAFAAYAQPLLDATDGSPEQIQRAFALSQVCYNLAMLPAESRTEALAKMQISLQMDDQEFDDLKSSVVLPMLQRHEEMFARLHSLGGTGFSAGISGTYERRESARQDSFTETVSRTDRYAPCPCGSDKKYKFCCGKKRPK